jgi:hypothetical protein
MSLQKVLTLYVQIYLDDRIIKSSRKKYLAANFQPLDSSNHKNWIRKGSHRGEN